MSHGERKIFPVQVVISYWEIQPARIGAYLDRLVENGARHFAALIPWRLFESDITHSLHRFIGAVADRNLTLSLVVTPELGLHYPLSGFPRELVNGSDAEATSSAGDPVTITLPPGSFTLPSLHHPETQKRYQSYISRLSSFLADLSHGKGEWASKTTLIVGGSLWKSYRSPWGSAGHAFGTTCGDRSRASTLAFQQHLDRFLSGVDTDPELKGGAYEEPHRRAFDAECESVFRRKTMHALHRRDLTMSVRELELHVPDSDPSLSLSQLARGFTGASGVKALSSLIEEIGLREGAGAEEAAPPAVYFSSMGGFSRLSDQDRQFLILKSLLFLGTRGGSVWLDSEDWLRATPAFRSKLDRFGKSIQDGGLRRFPKARYVVPQLWSRPDQGWECLHSHLGADASLLQYGEDRLKSVDASLLLVDRSLFLSRDKMASLLRWLDDSPADSSRVLALPKTPFMTEGALTELKRFTGDSERMDLQKGFAFRLYRKREREALLVFFDPPEILSTREELEKGWTPFLETAAILAGIPARGKETAGDAFSFRVEGDAGSVWFAFNDSNEARPFRGAEPMEVPGKGIVSVPVPALSASEGALGASDAPAVSTASIGLKEEKKNGTTSRLESARKGVPPEVGTR